MRNEQLKHFKKTLRPLVITELILWLACGAYCALYGIFVSHFAQSGQFAALLQQIAGPYAYAMTGMDYGFTTSWWYVGTIIVTSAIGAVAAVIMAARLHHYYKQCDYATYPIVHWYRRMGLQIALRVILSSGLLLIPYFIQLGKIRREPEMDDLQAVEGDAGVARQLDGGRLSVKRKWMQLYFAVLFNANLKGFITGNIYTGNTKTACVPGINCYSCPGAVGACPLGSLQGSFGAQRSTLFYVGGTLLLYSIMFGRMICGWLCPFGLIQEWLYKLKTPKVKKSPVTRVLSYLKYVILVVFVFIIPILYALRDTPLPAFCKYICPAGTLEGGMTLLANEVNNSFFEMLGPIFTWKFLMMVSILVGCIFVFRLFCRFLCPLGALYGLFNKLSVFGIALDKGKCVGCNKCIAHCKMDIREVGDHECISCGECAAVCPADAIKWKGPKFLVNKADGDKHRTARTVVRAIVAAVMAAALIGSVAYFALQDTDLALNPGQAQKDRGNQVGDLCYGYDLTVVDGNGPTGETIDPSATGTVTVINFWGTWCTPCVKELPYFDQIATEYGDDVTVVAAHGMATNTAPAYIAKYYPNSKMVFAYDYIPEGGSIENGYYTTLGGRNNAYPYTLVLDADGVVTHVFVSSVTYDMLKTAVDEAME